MKKWIIIIKIIEKNIQLRKTLEHGDKKDVSGKEVDELLNNAEDYLKRIKELFSQIEKRKEKENVNLTKYIGWNEKLYGLFNGIIA